MTLSFSNLNEIWNLYENIAASEQEQLNEAPMTAFQAAGGNAKLKELGKGKGTVTAASIEKLGQDNLFKAGGGQAAIDKGPKQSAGRAGMRSTLTRQDIINRGTIAAKPAPTAATTPAATTPAATTPAATTPARTTPAAASAKTSSSTPTPAKTLPSKPAVPTGTTAGGTTFQRRAATGAELRAAQAARAAGKGEEGAIKASVAASKPAATSTLSAATAAASKPAAFKPATTSQATSAAGSTKAPDPATSFSKTTAATPKPITPNPSASTPAAPAGNFTKKEGDGLPRKPEDRLFEGVDAYDLVLEYLLNNGHVDTVEEAHYVMMEMPAETIQTIVEGAVGEFADKVASTVGSAVGTVQRAAREIPKYAKQKVDNVAGTYEYARQRADANAPSGAKNSKMSVPTKPSTPRSREFSHGGKPGMSNPGPNFGR